MNRGGLTGGQLFWIAFIVMFPTVTLLLPGDLLRLAGRYAWWTPLVAAVPAAACAWVVRAAAGRRGDLVRATLRGLGPVGGRVLLALAWLATGVYTVVAVRETTDLAAELFIFREVPIPVLDLLGMVPAAIYAWLGPIVFARAAAILAGAALTTHIGALLGALPTAHVIWALPLLPRDLRFATLRPLDLMSVWLMEPAFVGAMLMHRVAPGSRARAAGPLVGAVVVAAVLTSVTLWVMVANLGAQFAAVLVTPFDSLVRGIGFGNVQRLDTLVLPFMVIGSALKLGILFYIWARIGSGLLGGWAAEALAGVVLLAGALGIVLIPSPQAADRALSTWVGVRALPVLLAVMLLPYAVCAVRSAGRPQ